MDRMKRLKRHIHLLGAVACLLLATPAFATVAVDQNPLTVQQTLPPNIQLMFDDSGSMAWDYMPDWNYLTNTTDDGVRDSSINGTYYNPNVLYTPPPTADGSANYPDSGTDPNNPLATAYNDGFHTGYGTTDITTYSSPTKSFPYYDQYTANVTTNYPPTLGCKSGDGFATDSAHQGQCASISGATYTYYAPYGHSYNPYCNTGDQLTYVGHGRNRQLECQHIEYAYTYYSPNVETCPSAAPMTPARTCASSMKRPRHRCLPTPRQDRRVAPIFIIMSASRSRIATSLWRPIPHLEPPATTALPRNRT